MSASGKSSTAPPPDLEAELDELYALDLSQFVRRRDELARELKAQGDQSAAEAVAALGKATVPAWVVNRLALESRESWQGLLDAGEGLRAAQQTGDGDELRRAQRERTESLARLLDEAQRLLEESAHAASQTTLEKIRRTLETVAVYGRSGLLPVRPGRLTRELDPPGFEVLATLSSLPARPRRSRARRAKAGSSETPSRRDRKTTPKSRSEPSATRAASAQPKRAGELRRALRRAQTRLETARAREAEDESRAARLRSDLAAIGQGLERLRRELGKLEKDEERTRGELEAAREKLDRSRDRRVGIEREVETARRSLEDES